jgi:hypothetical protein
MFYEHRKPFFGLFFGVRCKMCYPARPARAMGGMQWPHRVTWRLTFGKYSEGGVSLLGYCHKVTYDNPEAKTVYY